MTGITKKGLPINSIGLSSDIGVGLLIGGHGININSAIVASNFCEAPTLIDQGNNRASAIINGIIATGKRNSSTAENQSSVNIFDTATEFQSTSAIVQQNWIYDSSVSIGITQRYGVSLIFSSTSYVAVVEIMLLLRPVAEYGNTGVALVNKITNTILHDNITLNSGYELAVAIDMNTGVGYYDDGVNSGTVAASGLFGNTEPMQGFITYNLGNTLNDEITGKFNQGSEAFGIEISNAVSWCGVVP
jgi:hypothetical protein